MPEKETGRFHRFWHYHTVFYVFSSNLPLSDGWNHLLYPLKRELGLSKLTWGVKRQCGWSKVRLFNGMVNSTITFQGREVKSF
jgi:hypothetical protein